MVIAIVIYVCFFVLLVILHRVRIRNNPSTPSILFIFLPGFLLVCLLLWNATFPISAIVTYVLLSILTVFLTITPLLGNRGPTFDLLKQVQEKNAIRFPNISATHELEKRLLDLQRVQFIVKNQSSYTLSSFGKILFPFVEWYCHMFNVPDPL